MTTWAGDGDLVTCYRSPKVSSIMDIDLPKDIAKVLESHSARAGDFQPQIQLTALQGDPPSREEIDTFGTLAEDEDAGPGGQTRENAGNSMDLRQHRCGFLGNIMGYDQPNNGGYPLVSKMAGKSPNQMEVSLFPTRVWWAEGKGRPKINRNQRFRSRFEGEIHDLDP